MYTGSGIPYGITNVCMTEILPAVFLLHYMWTHIAYETFIYYLYTTYTCNTLYKYLFTFV